MTNQLTQSLIEAINAADARRAAEGISPSREPLRFVTPKESLEITVAIQAHEIQHQREELEKITKDRDLWKFRAVENGKTVKRQKAELQRKAEEHTNITDGK